MFSPASKPENKPQASESSENQPKIPSISLPKGGGAIRGIGEKFAANPVTGTGSLSVPIFASPGRSGFGPQLSLSYDSGSGNGPFGIGWNLSLPLITRKTDKGLPRYLDLEESDVFILSGAEDLVPVFKKNEDGNLVPDEEEREGYRVKRYRPRIEGLFARIERWTLDGDTHWRSISKDNILTVYGRDNKSRIYDPADESRIFSWLICESYDDKGNAIHYEYLAENNDKIDLSQANERNRIRTSNRYIKRIKYGNRKPLLLDTTKPGFRKIHIEQTDFSSADWMFEVVFDYDEGHYDVVPLDENIPESKQHQYVQASSFAASNWSVRPDPFSAYRAGFEVRTYRRCQRVLMFHYFQELASEKGDANSEPIILPYLVRSTEFDYSDSDNLEQLDAEKGLKNKGTTSLSFIRAVTQSGYVRDESQLVIEKSGIKYLKFIKKSLPPLVFEYSQANIQDEIKDIDVKSLENLPYGLDGTQYQWVDLDEEGISGILSEQAGALYYKRNISPISILKDELDNPVKNEYGDLLVKAQFGPMEVIKSIPSLANLSSGRQQLLDLAGDGQLDLAEFNSSTPGFYERTEDQQWKQFTPFTSLPNIDWNNPNLKFLDLTGDGHADIVITENEVFTWYESLAEAGFSRCERVIQALDEEKGPRLVFSDGTQSIYLADMSGDGLTDLARIRNSEVCYWPNLGYGRFGAKVTMDYSPLFDSQDQFNQQRIRLADIDGSGTTDIIYLKGDGVHIYFNQSGNSWTELEPRIPFPQVDNLTSVMTADLLGNGTACLVWSSPLPGNSRQQMRYIDLMGGQKPHLLVVTKNNLGAETRVHYAPSTKFYLEDQKAGKPWITRIPFPVHVVERVETYDRISRNRFVTRYTYHHGYFDGIEREFRGFGMVEQKDTEEIGEVGPEVTGTESTNWDKASFVPTVLTRTWFHTGIYIDRDRISNFFAGLIDESDQGEYYREPAWRNNDTGARKRLLNDTILPDGLTTEEEREACRALKGSMLRQEVYALDGTDKEQHPYTVTEQNFTIRLLQPQAGNRHAVFFTHAREAISYHYERNPEDPRITHSLTLDVDDFGNVLRSITVGYPHADVPERKPEQNETHLTLTLNRFANCNDNPDWRRIGMPVEARTYEVVKPPGTALRFTWDELHDLSMALVPLDESEPSLDKTIPYEQWDWRKYWNPQAEPGGLIKEILPGGLIKEKLPYTRLRLIEHVRTLYRPNDLGVFKHDTHALLPLGTVESLALPGESYKLAFTPGLANEVYGKRVTDAMLEAEGRYVHSEGDKNWWIPSGRVFYSPKEDDTPDDELTTACKHFFLPRRFCDPFGNNTILYYDSNETDPSSNYNLLLKETRDELGNTVTAENDYRVLQPKLITDPNGNRSEVRFDAFGMVIGTAVMGKEKGPIEGDSFETFTADLMPQEIKDYFDAADPRPLAIDHLGTATTRIIYDLDRVPACAATIARETHVSDLNGQQTKVQLSFSYSDGFGREIQKKIQAEPVLVNDKKGDPRWVGSGWTIFNNKGKPVRQYEPFFTDTHQFEFDVRIGVSPVLFYDPVERVVATLHPNHTYDKVVFDPWHQKTYDVNDTIMLDPRTDSDISGYVAEYFKQEAPDSKDWKTWLQQRDIDLNNLPKDTPGLDPEKKAAIRTLVHADTPTIAHFDSLGRMFLTIAHNKFKRSDAPDAKSPTEEFYSTRVIFDIEGNQREVIDAKLDTVTKNGRVVMRYDYDMLGNKIHQASMEAGERWILSNVANNPIRTWDSRGFEKLMTYDSLKRPLELNVTDSAGNKFLVEKTEYGESKQDRKAEETNHRLKPWKIYDGAGVLINDSYDFKGNLEQSNRRLLPLSDCKDQVNWTLNPEPDETFISSTRYDALNRPIQIVAPHSDKAGTLLSVTQLVYNEANLLERVDVWLEQNAEPNELLDPNKATHHAVKNIDYNAKGQRELIEYGNGAESRYTYDPETFRLINLYTRRGMSFNEDCGGNPPSPLFSSPVEPPTGKTCGLQNLFYTYDPVGNIIHIHDEAQQTIYFKGEVVKPDADYTYDAIYRLIEAHGREHIGNASQPETTWNDQYHVGLEHPNDGQKMRNYFEYYTYDEVGNITIFDHKSDGTGNWIRTYHYDEQSLIETSKNSNRLSSTTVRGNTSSYMYDEHGNMTRMPDFATKDYPDQPNMYWDFKDELQMVDKGGGCKAYYVYDATGQRVRKVMEKDGKTLNERIYIGSYEIYRKYNGSKNGPILERESLHIMDDKQRIALVDTKTIDIDCDQEKLPETLIRYQFSNHLGSASLELDDNADIISYEEYYPYGSTSYQAVRSKNPGSVEVSTKRHRYAGKERDEETGLYYYGARYYTPWIGRWTACDPKGLVDGANIYCYVKNNPIVKLDLLGTETKNNESTFGKDVINNLHLLDEPEYKSGLKFDPFSVNSPSQSFDWTDFQRSLTPEQRAKYYVVSKRRQQLTSSGGKTILPDSDGSQLPFYYSKEDQELDTLNPFLSWLPGAKAGWALAQALSGHTVSGQPVNRSSKLLEASFSLAMDWATVELFAAAAGAGGTGLRQLSLNAPKLLNKSSIMMRSSNLLQGVERAPNPFANLTDAEIEGALSNMSSRHIFRGPVTATEAGHAVETMTPVSRWGRQGLQPGNWVMKGPPTYSNYVRSFKWDPNPTNIRAPFSAGEGYVVPPSHVTPPTGWGLDGWWKSLFGQRKYTP